MSEEDDSLGYDIMYSCDSGKTWRYVEVKSFMGNEFILTKNEFDCYEENKSRYEIFLVDENDKILPLRDIELDNEKKFNMNPKDYTVRFRIPA